MRKKDKNEIKDFIFVGGIISLNILLDLSVLTGFLSQYNAGEEILNLVKLCLGILSIISLAIISIITLDYNFGNRRKK